MALEVVEAFMYFYHSDYGNAAIHRAKVKFSPITFALAAYLANDEPILTLRQEILEVLADTDKYELDPGR